MPACRKSASLRGCGGTAAAAAGWWWWLGLQPPEPHLISCPQDGQDAGPPQPCKRARKHNHGQKTYTQRWNACEEHTLRPESRRTQYYNVC